MTKSRVSPSQISSKIMFSYLFTKFSVGNRCPFACYHFLHQLVMPSNALGTDTIMLELVANWKIR